MRECFEQLSFSLSLDLQSRQMAWLKIWQSFHQNQIQESDEYLQVPIQVNTSIYNLNNKL